MSKVSQATLVMHDRARRQPADLTHWANAKQHIQGDSSGRKDHKTGDDSVRHMITHEAARLPVRLAGHAIRGRITSTLAGSRAQVCGATEGAARHVPDSRN